MSDVPGRDLVYNQLEYRQYSERLRALCNKNKHAAKVLSDVFKDPISGFKSYHAQAAGLFSNEELSYTPAAGGNAEIKTEDAVLEDPQGCLKIFANAMLGKPVNNGVGFTEKVKEKLEEQITNWMVGETTIYAIAAESLREHPKLISSNKNAGRHLLRDLG